MRTIAVAVLAIAAILGSTVVVSASVLAAQAPALDLGTDDLVPLEQAQARQASRPTTVLAADGQTLGQFLPVERFEPIGPDEIPELVSAVVTASEDPDFFEHHGFTLQGVARAALANASAGDTVEGGSTITQQLAKNLYTDGERTLARKAREVAIATTLEDTYSKQQILAAYLNSTYFGEGALGIRAASLVYFGKPIEQLNLSEVALLVGLIPAPSDRDPRTHPDVAEAWRLHVLRRTEETGRFDHAAVAAAQAQPPPLAAPPTAVSSQPFFTEYVRQWLLDVAHLPPEQVLGGGLRVETSLDLRVQDAAVTAVNTHLPDPNGPTAALVVLDHRTGHVRAMVGGRDWNASKVDLARGFEGGGTGRQPGSSFKPFVLATALVAGFRPDSPVPAPSSIEVEGADHAIENYSGGGYGTVSVTDATVKSINTSYSWITEQVGPQQVRDLAASLGITHLPPDGIGPSIGLGAYETSPLEMATAYSTIAQDGRRVTPVPVVRVTAPDGTVIVDNSAPAPGAVVLDAAVCRTVTSILGQVVDRGTGTAAKLDRPAAGKTGTTDDYSNAWFVGYTNQLTGAVWVGHPTANTPMHDVNGVADVAGGTLPARIWRDVMAAASADLPVESFPALLPLPPGTRSDLPVPTAPAPAPGAQPEPRPDKPSKKPRGR